MYAGIIKRLLGSAKKVPEWAAIHCVITVLESGRKETIMAKSVSSKTHSQKELDDFANQNNPNNKAYKARVENTKNNPSKKKLANNRKKKLKRQAEFDSKLGLNANLDWFCYSNPYDFD